MNLQSERKGYVCLRKTLCNDSHSSSCSTVKTIHILTSSLAAATFTVKNLPHIEYQRICVHRLSQESRWPISEHMYLLLPENEGYIAEYHPEQRSCEEWYEERYFPSTRVIIDLSQSFRNFFFRFTKGTVLLG